jgi:transcriptional regulator with XRE-family HTH domain
MALFSPLLRDALRARGLGVRAYARLIGVSPASVSQVLNERRKPSLKTFDRWTACLDLTPAQRKKLLRAALSLWTQPRNH